MFCTRPASDDCHFRHLLGTTEMKSCVSTNKTHDAVASRLCALRNTRRFIFLLLNRDEH